jgi:hypothetical protein
MDRSTSRARFVLTVPALLVLAGCGEQRAPTEVARVSGTSAALSREGPHMGAIVAHDSCDPDSFNAALGPGTCVKPGQTTFDEFIAELSATQVVRDWRFTPEHLTAQAGNNLLGNNVGGEEHTFTPVAQFGGGIIDILNQLAGTPDPAPECLALDEDDLVPSGGHYLIEAEELAEVTDGSGIARVQCCIHPWMRAEVRVK